MLTHNDNSVDEGLTEETKEILNKIYAAGGDSPEDNAQARALLWQVMKNCNQIYAEAELRYGALMDLYYSGPHNH